MAFKFTRTNSSPNVGYEPMPILGKPVKKKTPILGRNDSQRKKIKAVLKEISDLSRSPVSTKKSAKQKKAKEMRRLESKLRTLRSIIV